MSKPERPTAGWSRDEPWAQVAETHAAAVFLAGVLACKLKKPVNLGFLDFSTVAARTVACAREAELNLRFAPDVYLGVAELRGPDGEVLRAQAAGQTMRAAIGQMADRLQARLGRAARNWAGDDALRLDRRGDDPQRHLVHHVGERDDQPQPRCPLPSSALPARPGRRPVRYEVRIGLPDCGIEGRRSWLAAGRSSPEVAVRKRRAWRIRGRVIRWRWPTALFAGIRRSRWLGRRPRSAAP